MLAALQVTDHVGGIGAAEVARLASVLVPVQFLPENMSGTTNL